MTTLAQPQTRPTPAPAGRPGGEARPMMIWGQIPLEILTSGDETNGDLLVFRHRDMGKGGPPRHVHPAQDEWFLVQAGEFHVEVGGRHHRLRAGDSLLAPRGVPHAWACVGDAPGTLLTIVTPVGPFERFILDTTRHPTLPPPDEIARAMSDGGMTLLGPPLDVGTR